MNFRKTLSFISAMAVTVSTMGTFSFGESAGPVVHYNFNGNLEDSSGNSYDARRTGKVIYVAGVKGQAAEFNGGFLEILNSNKLDLNKAFSMSLWIKQAAELDRTNPIVYKGAEDSDEEAVIYFGLGNGSTTLGSYLGFGEDYYNYASDITSSKPLDPSTTVEKWCHLGYVFDGKQQRYYVDGELTDTKDIPQEVLNYSSAISDSSKNILIGKGYDFMYKGLMDELKLYDYAITDDQITALYNNGDETPKNKIVLQLDNEFMYIDDERVEIDPGRSTVPVVINGRTLVPVRAIIEAMGGRVDWISDERRVDVILKDNTIKLWLENLSADVNGNRMQLEVPPQIINERTMLPLRFVSENLGAKVDWDGDTSKITINFNR